MAVEIESEEAAEESQPRRPVQATADRLRDMIFAQEPDSRIGSLTGLAKSLGVGIVTVQQAARILEYEGLLEVRRGPGGGYYGARPDAAAIERSLAAYMRMKPHSWEEALDMTSLLFNELCAAAAGCTGDPLHEELTEFDRRVELCDGDTDMAVLEQDFQDLLFRMVDRPLFELLTRVTLRFATSRPADALYKGIIAVEEWKAGRHRIIDAILRRDEELARFEANRSNRRLLLRQLGKL